MSWVELPLPVDAAATRECVLETAIRLHDAVSPGFRENVYRRLLAHSLRKQGSTVREEVWLAAEFDGLRIDQAGRADLVVDERVIVELKATEGVAFGRAQLVGYLRATEIPIGLLLNFHSPLLRRGSDRVVHPRFLRWIE